MSKWSIPLLKNWMPFASIPANNPCKSNNSAPLKDTSFRASLHMLFEHKRGPDEYLNGQMLRPIPASRKTWSRQSRSTFARRSSTWVASLLVPVFLTLIPKMIDSSKDSQGSQFLADVLRYICLVGHTSQPENVVETIKINLPKEVVDMGSIAARAGFFEIGRASCRERV